MRRIESRELPAFLNEITTARIDRRRALTGLGALLASLGLAGTVGQALAAIPTPPGEPVAGGVLTFQLQSEPPNFDTLAATTSTVINCVGPCTNSLIMYDPLEPDTIVGDLAESWEVSEDGLTYTFKLIKTAIFHDGVPLTSADVKFTYDTVRNPTDGYVSVRSNVLAAVDSIEAPDDYTIVLKLSRPSPSLLANLAGGFMVVLPKHELEKGPMTDRIVGSGPFMLKEYVRGVSVELVRNPNYHVPDRPYLDGIKMYIITDPSTRLAYFRSGDLLVQDYMSLDGVQQTQREFIDRVYIQESTSYEIVMLRFNTAQKPWDDIRVRQAVSMAFDRTGALATAFRGAGVVTSLSAPGQWELPVDVRADIPGLGDAPDLEGAKALLAEAGFANGFDTKLLCRRIARLEPVGVFAVDQLRRLGINATLDLQETAAYFETMESRNFGVEVGGFGYDANDPDSMFGDTITSSGGQNYSNLENAEIDALYAEQSQTEDPEVRRKLVNQMEELALRQYTSHPLFFTSRFAGYANRVQNYLLHPSPDNNRRMSEVWLAAV